MWPRTALVLVCLQVATFAAAQSRDPLGRARLAYNQGQWDAAIAAADEARKNPDRADSADLIAARAYLERFRTNQADDDLVSGRERLRRLNPSKFSGSERIEFLVGLGEALYLDGQSGAAAVVFESVIEPSVELPGDARDRVLDWWATALDRDARPRPEIDRREIYQRVRNRMADELTVNPGSAPASYWLANAARGQGDLQAAWDAAQAGWTRAVLAADGGGKLRADLDDLVRTAIVPERSRVLGQPAEDLAAEWETFKDKWR
jgi:hypothetical protein